MELLLKKLQDDLIKKTQGSHEISPRVVEAFYKYPRHEFVPTRYSVQEAYTDSPLALFQKQRQKSTISQPSFVLYLLELLKLEKGQKIFEVGTGSAWNAALMSYLVGDQGRVVSMEIIPELAQSAKQIVQTHQIKNLEVIEGDASRGWAPEAPYDRIVFTAGAPRLPSFVAEQLKLGGWVLFVQAGAYFVDEVQLLEKTPAGFKALQRLACHFVSMTGSVAESTADSADDSTDASTTEKPNKGLSKFPHSQ